MYQTIAFILMSLVWLQAAAMLVGIALKNHAIEGVLATIALSFLYLKEVGYLIDHSRISDVFVFITITLAAGIFWYLADKYDTAYRFENDKDDHSHLDFDLDRNESYDWKKDIHGRDW